MLEKFIPDKMERTPVIEVSKKEKIPEAAQRMLSDLKDMIGDGKGWSVAVFYTDNDNKPWFPQPEKITEKSTLALHVETHASPERFENTKFPIKIQCLYDK